MTETLAGELNKLAALRKALDDADKAWQSAYGTFMLECGHLDEAKKAAKQAERDQYEKTVAAALTAFKETGDKKPDDDVQVKHFDSVEYDAAAALQWAIGAGLTTLLTLDTKKFETAVKAGVVPTDIAQVVNDWRPTISARLGHRLILIQDDATEQP